MNLRGCAAALAIAALLAATTGVRAETRAWLDRDRIELGETATLNVETDQATAQAPDFSPLLPDFVVSGHSSSRSIELVNGQRRARVLFAVAVEPRREGLATIPALRVGGETTAPLPLSVVPASAAPARRGEPVFIEAETDLQDPYVQQSVGYVLRLYYAMPLVSGQLDQPEPEGASMQRIGGDVQFSRDLAGKRYTVVERRFQIVPERSGTLTIPGAVFEGRGVGGFFDDVLGDGRRALRARGAPRIVQVRPVPDAAPQPWLPVRGLELRYLSTPQSARAGEAAELSVELVVDGAAASQLPELQLPPIDGAQVFPEPPQIDERFENGRLQTRVTRRYSIVPGVAGRLRVPGPRQAWWDVRAGTRRMATLLDLSIEVAAGSVAQASPIADDGVRSPVAGARWIPSANAWPWIAIAFALLWLGTLAWAVRTRRWLPTPRSAGEAAPGDVEPGGASVSPRDLVRVLQTGDLGDVEQVLCALARPPVANLDALAAHLDDRAQRDAVALLQQARWGGGDVVAARAALQSAFREGPRWRAEAASADAGHALLPPLYPERSRS